MELIAGRPVSDLMIGQLVMLRIEVVTKRNGHLAFSGRLAAGRSQ
jgi:hypothetical protein